VSCPPSRDSRGRNVDRAGEKFFQRKTTKEVAEKGPTLKRVCLEPAESKEMQHEKKRRKKKRERQRLQRSIGNSRISAGDGGSREGTGEGRAERKEERSHLNNARSRRREKPSVFRTRKRRLVIAGKNPRNFAESVNFYDRGAHHV